ncbi:MAG: asparagine--tRNA ligase [Candidatus Auribacterota bacterium]|jgi:asparaginyl-tRNA synthetase|nr:asparagine--tRNA ligase [Candidatus Auribacterota bacterium]
MNRTRIHDILINSQPGAKVKVCGWVRTRRDSKGGFSFIELNDGSCLKNLQVIADQQLSNYTAEILKLTTGASVCAYGEVVESPASGQRVELRAEAVEVLGWADPESYLLQKKRHSLEFLRTIAHLRPRTNTFGAVTRVRNTLSYAIHTFFHDRGFQYIHTPIITASDCEGAGEMFRVTTLPLENIPRLDGKVDFSGDFFGKPTNLTVSGQLEAEIYAMAFGDVYTFGPTFRAENSNTSRHLAEFWMVEPEMAFCDLQQDASVAEEFLKYLISEILEKCHDDLLFFNEFIEKNLLATLNHIVSSKFKMLPYTDAVDLLIKSGRPFDYPVEWGLNLQAEHERYLAEDYFKAPVILIDFPRSIKPFYMRCNDDGKTVTAMDILFPEIGEIIGGSQREERYDVLLERMDECRLNRDDYWWYMELRKYGSAPHAGFGLGFDRLVQFVTGMKNIRDVIPFPRTPQNAEF